MAKVTIGIDVGGSTTKIVGFRDGAAEALIAPSLVRAADPVTSVYGALGKFTTENQLSLADISKIMVTGVGSSFLGESLYGCRCEKAAEFASVGRGGLFLSGLDRAIVVSMGTGTALVSAVKDRDSVYLGGTGVGGGTLMGLAKQMLGMDNIDHLVALAVKGDLSKVDLRIADISKQDEKLGLPSHMTAANFGKLSDLATREDLAMGLLNMVFETIGMMAIFAARAAGVQDIVLTGHLSAVPVAKTVFASMNAMFDVNFVIPDRSQFATVIGAALGGI